MMHAHKQVTVDQKNAEFWNELCGTQMARSLGINDFSESSIKKYDEWYFNFYPYLKKYFDMIPIGGNILEIGLGYGTGATYLAKRADQYFGLDIANGPVNVVNQRLEYLNMPQTARVGSVHNIPFEDEYFDALVSIGCFHHTGNIQQCINESYRVLKKNGCLLFMCYNKHSFRILRKFPKKVFFNKNELVALNQQGTVLYDTNSQLEGAPCTELAGKKYYKQICGNFAECSVHRENWEGSSREKRLKNLAKLLGLDLYVFCKK